MLRKTLIASVFPLLAAGILAQAQIGSAGAPCLASGGTAWRLSTFPWQTDRQVAFTQTRSQASVTVQLVEDPGLADFTYIDGPDSSAEGTACEGMAEAHYLAVTGTSRDASATVYLSAEDGADYRIYVQSSRLSAREAAALLIGAARDRRMAMKASGDDAPAGPH